MTKEIQKPPTRRDAWADLDRLFDDMRQRYFDAFALQPWGPAFPPLLRTTAEPFLRAPRTDVTDTGKAFKIVAEVPGIPKESIDIRVRGSIVEIKAEAAKESKKSDEGLVHHERTYSGYYRSLELPEPVAATDAKAKVENGVLELELPKQNPTPPESGVKVAVQ